MSPTGRCRKRHSLTLLDKIRIIDKIERNPEENKVAIAKRLNYPPTTVYTVWAQKDEIQVKALQSGHISAKTKRLRAGSFDDLDKTLYEWFR